MTTPDRPAHELSEADLLRIRELAQSQPTYRVSLEADVTLEMVAEILDGRKAIAELGARVASLLSLNKPLERSEEATRAILNHELGARIATLQARLSEWERAWEEEYEKELRGLRIAFVWQRSAATVLQQLRERVQALGEEARGQ